MTVISSIMDVFSAILEWFADAFEAVTAMFYSAETGLTFIGVVSVLTLGIAVFTLVIGWIRGLIR